VETACYAPSVPPAKDELVVVAYNIERGLKLDQILAGFASGQLPDADVVLISETDRGCSRTDGRDVTRELAQALAMNYVFAVEFVELPRVGGPGGTIEAPCEHGNAVLSKYPLGNVQALRHAMAKEWYGGDEPRLGGRISVGADVLVGDRVLHAWSLHFESDISETYRAPQAAELADVAAMGASTGAVVVGGDTNAGTYVVDIGLGTMNNPTVKAFTDRGYLDAHRSLPALQRPTRDPLVLDLIFTLGDIASAPGICPLSSCPFSDHAPVWATVALR
jgi:endonuclease/exonuclease/phosphatase family metal-dependent hydrolase